MELATVFLIIILAIVINVPLSLLRWYLHKKETDRKLNELKKWFDEKDKELDERLKKLEDDELLKFREGQCKECREARAEWFCENCPFSKETRKQFINHNEKR